MPLVALAGILNGSIEGEEEGLPAGIESLASFSASLSLSYSDTRLFLGNVFEEVAVALGFDELRIKIHWSRSILFHTSE